MRHTKGFTLVELSIVLVIIGLLIGGILAAQSMIVTTKIQAVVRQLQQYDIAVSNFHTKYNQLPGDSKLFPGLYPNNNGFIDGGINGDPGETAYFWNHLSLGVGLTNYQGNPYSSIFDNAWVPNQTNCPKFDLNQQSSVPNCLSVGSNDYSHGAGKQNYYGYYKYANGLLNGGDYNITAVDALAIDKKTDDGVWNMGKVYANSPYNLSNKNYDYYLVFQLGL